MDPINTLPASAPSWEVSVRQILDRQRALAHDALDDLMYESFLEIGQLLGETAATPGRAVGGLSAFALLQIRQHFLSGDLKDWLMAGADGDKTLYLRDFLNFNMLQMNELKQRYPRAFTKWTPEEDAALLARYQQDSEGGKRVPWGRIARDLGRNPNAVPLRLGYLGIDLGPESGRPRRAGGTAR